MGFEENQLYIPICWMLMERQCKKKKKFIYFHLMDVDGDDACRPNIHQFSLPRAL